MGFDSGEGASDCSGEIGRSGAGDEKKELSAAAVHCLLLDLAGQHVHADVPSSACTRVVRLETEEK